MKFIEQKTKSELSSLKWFFTKKLIVGALSISLLIESVPFTFGFPAPQSNPSQIRVRIAESDPQVRVRGYDLRFFLSTEVPVSSLVGVDKLSEWEIQCKENTIRIKLLSNGVKSSPPLHTVKESVVLRSQSGFLTYKNVLYRNELKIYAKNNSCEVINTVEIEKYLDGLVNSEFSSRWSEASVGAQIIAARTYALYQMQEAKKKGLRFDVESTVKDQVYDGSQKETFRASKIVDKTKGMILTDSKNNLIKPIKAFYHSTCGGLTELPERVWGSQYPGFKRKVNCPYCYSSPRFRWKIDLTSKEIASRFLNGIEKSQTPKNWPSGASSILSQSQLSKIEIRLDSVKDRVSEVITTWKNGKESIKLSVSAFLFREWIGVQQFRSTSFQVMDHFTANGRKWTFSGKGNGHGVGMCQWGAKVMGEKGYDAVSILKHYYPDAVVRKAW